MTTHDRELDGRSAAPARRHEPFSWDCLAEGPRTWRVWIGRTAGAAPDSKS